MKFRKLLCASLCTFIVGQCIVSAEASDKTVSRIVIPVVSAALLLTVGITGYHYLFKGNDDANNTDKSPGNGSSPDNIESQKGTSETKPEVLTPKLPEQVHTPPKSSPDLEPSVLGSTTAVTTNKPSVPNQPEKAVITPTLGPDSFEEIDAPSKSLLNPEPGSIEHKAEVPESSKKMDSPLVVSSSGDEDGEEAEIFVPSLVEPKTIDELIEMVNNFNPDYSRALHGMHEVQRGSTFSYVPDKEYLDPGQVVPKLFAFDGSPYVTSKQLMDTVNNVTAILKDEPSLLNIESDDGVMVVGDLHGNLDSLKKILLSFFDMFKSGEVKSIVFLGDYIDRQIFSVEILQLLYQLKINMPENVYLLKGNHEHSGDLISWGAFYVCCSGETKHKYGSDEGKKLNSAISESFKALPLAAKLNDYFCVHGGIAEKMVAKGGLDLVQKIDRMADEAADEEGEDDMEDSSDIATEILWSELNYNLRGGTTSFTPSSRGLGHIYSPKTLGTFLENNDLSGMISGHVHENAVHKLKDNRKHITLLSSRKFADHDENQCKVAVLKKGEEPCILQINDDGEMEEVTD